MQDWISVAQAAEVIGYKDRRAVNYLLTQGKVPKKSFTRVGRAYLVSRSWAQQYVKSPVGRPKKASA